MNAPKVSYKIVKFTVLALFILLQLYLIFLKSHYALDLDITPNTQPSPNLFAEEKIGQTFLAKRNGLTRIDVMLGTHKRTNNKNITFTLRERIPERKVIFQTTFNAASVIDNLYHPIFFKPIHNSRNKEYYFVLHSPESTFDNSLSVWTNTRNLYREGQLMIKHQPMLGDMVFRVYSKRPIFTELSRIIRNYSGIFSKTWALILAILFFELVQILVLSKLLDFFRKNWQAN